MAEESGEEIQLLRSQKPKLIEILSADPDFVLQHADARRLLPLHAYQHVKSCRTPSEKVTELLDHVIQRGPEAAKELLELFKDNALQETFPRLDFINKLKVNTRSSGRLKFARFQQSFIPIRFLFLIYKYKDFFFTSKGGKKPQKKENKRLRYQMSFQTKGSATMVSGNALKYIPLSNSVKQSHTLTASSHRLWHGE